MIEIDASDIQGLDDYIQRVVSDDMPDIVEGLVEQELAGFTVSRLTDALRELRRHQEDLEQFVQAWSAGMDESFRPEPWTGVLPVGRR